MPTKAPHRRVNLVFLFQLLGPHHFAGLSVEAVQITFRPQRIDFTAGHRWRSARAGRIRNLVGTLVLVLPQLLAVAGAKTEHALFTSHFSPRAEVILGLTRRAQVVRDEHLA